MKKAIAYKRISTKDQSNFSLSGQDKYIIDWAEKNDAQIVASFTDDGKSAKNFDRPDWKMLEDFIKVHYREVDYLIVVKYDRFSRNAAMGLHKIELLEKKYRIIIISVFEQMFIDYDSPFFFKQRADMLVNAEFELHVIRDRTKFGIHEALRLGRHVNRAPFGYINAKEDKKPVIVIDENRSGIIKEIFSSYLLNTPLNEIAKEARKNGFSLRGRSAILRVLENCVYAGLIFVPAYRKEASAYVKGLHTPIISENLWWATQNKLGKNNVVRTIFNEEVPLRGSLKCFCGRSYTAGNSKGKNKYYWYYKCNTHVENNYSATRLHSQFDEVLSHFSFKETQLNFLLASAKTEMTKQLKEKNSRLFEKEKEFSTALQQLENLEDKFINNLINAETYNKWYSKYKQQEVAIRHQVADLRSDNAEAWQLFDRNLYKLGDVKELFKMSSIQQKQTFLQLVFNSQLHYYNNSYRTPFLISLFKHNEMILKEKGLLIIEQPTNKLGEFAVSSEIGS